MNFITLSVSFVFVLLWFYRSLCFIEILVVIVRSEQSESDVYVLDADGFLFGRGKLLRPRAWTILQRELLYIVFFCVGLYLPSTCWIIRKWWLLIFAFLSIRFRLSSTKWIESAWWWTSLDCPNRRWCWHCRQQRRHCYSPTCCPSRFAIVP
jgi:hypothetical protein